MIRFVVTFALLLLPCLVWASGGNEGGGHELIMQTLLALVIILPAAKIAGIIMQKLSQPEVLGQLLLGVLLGSLKYVGIVFFSEIMHNIIFIFLAELGALILLAKIGLESNLEDMKEKSGVAVLVAAVGMIVPGVSIMLLTRYMMPDSSLVEQLFMGAIATATSVGITGKIFAEKRMGKTDQAQTVIGAAVFDDIGGVIVLSIVAGLAEAMKANVAFNYMGPVWLFAKAMLFLVIFTFVGRVLAPRIGRLFSRFTDNTDVVTVLLVASILLGAFLSAWIGLAMIIGAYVAGLFSDSTTYKGFKDPEIVTDIRDAVAGADIQIVKHVEEAIERHHERHLEERLAVLEHILTALFFVLMGISVNIGVFANMDTIWFTLVLSLVAIIGKVAAGIPALPKYGFWGALMIGVAMVSRGEVGLIIANAGLMLGAISLSLFGSAVGMVIVTTFAAPPLLSLIIERMKMRGGLSVGATV